MDQQKQYVQAVRDFLTEINAERNLGLELHPFFPEIILEATSIDLGFKIRSTNEPTRVMSLVVAPWSFEAKDGKQRLTKRAMSEIDDHMSLFWNGTNVQHHIPVKV